MAIQGGLTGTFTSVPGVSHAIFQLMSLNQFFLGAREPTRRPQDTPRGGLANPVNKPHESFAPLGPCKPPFLASPAAPSFLLITRWVFVGNEAMSLPPKSTWPGTVHTERELGRARPSQGVSKVSAGAREWASSQFIA